jgi:hypothetical protein
MFHSRWLFIIFVLFQWKSDCIKKKSWERCGSLWLLYFPLNITYKSNNFSHSVVKIENMLSDSTDWADETKRSRDMPVRSVWLRTGRWPFSYWYWGSQNPLPNKNTILSIRQKARNMKLINPICVTRISRIGGSKTSPPIHNGNVFI